MEIDARTEIVRRKEIVLQKADDLMDNRRAMAIGVQTRVVLRETVRETANVDQKVIDPATVSANRRETGHATANAVRKRIVRATVNVVPIRVQKVARRVAMAKRTSRATRTSKSKSSPLETFSRSSSKTSSFGTAFCISA